MHSVLVFVLFLIFGASLDAQTMPTAVKKVSDKYACGTCHAPDTRLVGPSWKALARKQYNAKKMYQLIRKPQPGNWPDYPPMAPILTISNAEVKLIANWLSDLK